MAAGFLLASVFLVALLSELDYSSAFPRARSYSYPEAWDAVRQKQGGYGYGNRRPLQYIQALRQTHRKLQPNVHGQVQVKTWQKPQGSSLKVRSHAQMQNQPSLYHQTKPWSDEATKWTQEMSPIQHPPQRNHSLPKPRGFEFSLKIPFFDLQDQNKEITSIIKGSDLNTGGSDGPNHYSQQSYRPSSVQISSFFSSASGSEKGSTNYPNGEKIVHDVSKPNFQLSLSVPIPPITTSPRPSSSGGGFLANQQRPESDGFVQNSYIEVAKPQSSLTQSGSDRFFLNSASAVQQQTEHQTYEPIQTDHTNGILMTVLPGHASQHSTPSEQISQGKIPTEQGLVFPEPSAPSVPILQYPPLQSDNIYSSFYSAPIDPVSNDYDKGQSGHMVSLDTTNVHLSVSPSQYERAPSGHYSAGQVKPCGNSDGQCQTWQPAGTPLTFASEQYGQFKPSFGQNVETVPHLTPVHPSPPVSPSQHELPSSHQVATTTGNVVQMRPSDFSSSSSLYQHSRDQSGQDALLDHVSFFDPLSTDYPTQMRLPGQYNHRGQLNGHSKYNKLIINVDDETDADDGQYDYFAAPPTYMH